MPKASRHTNRAGAAGFGYAIRHAFAEFLLLPTCIIAAFLVLAGATSVVDRGRIPALLPARDLLERYVFADASGTSELLGVVAAALITVTTLTTTLLLIALQQSASTLTHQVYDQFLRRRSNQFSFSFFIGVSLYALITLATVGPINPVFGAALTFLMTIAALCLLLVLFYTTIDQMRPAVIMRAIHDHVLYGREKQLELLRSTRRVSACEAAVRASIVASTDGFISRIDIAPIAAVAAQCSAEVEAELRVSIGTFVAYEDPLAVVKASTEHDAHTLARAVEQAIHCEPQRDIATDPLAGIEELENIGWTSISTAQSDPDPGLLAIYSLRDLLARCAHEESSSHADERCAPIVYHDDVPTRLLNAFGSLAVAASESMQHQTCAAILHTFTVLFERLPPELRSRADDLILRILPTLGDHVLTYDLDAALQGLSEALARGSRPETAAAVESARRAMARSIGKLCSRSTRAG